MLELDRDPAVHALDADEVAFLRRAVEEQPRERLNHEPLERALERSCAVARMEAALGDAVENSVVDLEQQPSANNPLANEQPVELTAGDLADRLRAELMKDDDTVDPVEELGTEELLRFLDVAMNAVAGAVGTEPDR